MGEFADRRAKGFSQGERLKTALARALVHRPRNLLLDEPTNGLDVMAVRGPARAAAPAARAGHCVLFSSHVMQEVAALCDEVVVIAGGTVIARRHARRRSGAHRPGGARGGLRAAGRRGRAAVSLHALFIVFPRSSARTCASAARSSPHSSSDRCSGRRCSRACSACRSSAARRPRDRAARCSRWRTASAPRTSCSSSKEAGVTVTPVDYERGGARRGAGASPASAC